MATSGINIVQTTGQIVFRGYLVDNTGAIVSTGTTNLRLYELQDDGVLHSYDWNDNTFKSTALTTENQAMTHRTGNNGTTNTGVWSVILSTLTDFNKGQVYLAQITNSNATPATQTRQFQFGDAEGDLSVDATSKNLVVDLNMAQSVPTSPTADTVGKGMENIVDHIPVNIIEETTATASSDNTNVVLAGVTGTRVDDDFNNLLVIVYDGSDSSKAEMRTILDYTHSTLTIVLDSALSFTPTTNDRVEIYGTSAAQILSDLTSLTSGFGAASPNTLKAHLNAIMSKDATVPTTGVGTYDPSTDSLEAAGISLTDIKGSGFSTSTDSLDAIRQYLVDILTPNVVTSSALSGSGFLSDCTSWIRKTTDEPSTEPKYTDADIVELIHNAFDTEMADININTDHPIKVRLNISIVDGQQYYTLPPNCASVWQVAKIISSTNTPQWEVWPASDFNFAGHGFQIEGNAIRLLRDWNESETLQVTYIPNGETAIHKGTASAATSTTITLASSPTDGSLDTRANAYGGYMVRILSNDSGRVEERIITAYDNTTRIATINESWDTTPTGTIVYEVLPLYSRLLRDVVTRRAAMDILGNEGLAQKLRTQERLYMSRKSALRRFLATKQGRFPHHMEGDNADNIGRSGLLGGFY